MTEEIIFTTESACETDTEAAGERLARMLDLGGSEYPVVAMRGDLGSGKTVFVRGMARYLSPAAAVRSPTYTVVNEYKGNPPLFHFDLYRITSEDDLLSVGYFDYLERGITVLEWSENLPFELDPGAYTVSFEKLGESKRKITVSVLK